MFLALLLLATMQGEVEEASPYLSLPQAAYEITHPTIDKRVVGAYFLANVADLYTTYQILDDGGKEMNPLLKVAGDDKWEVMATGATFKVGYYFLLRHLHNRGRLSTKWSNILLGGAAVLDAGAAWHNTGEY